MREDAVLSPEHARILPQGFRMVRVRVQCSGPRQVVDLGDSSKAAVHRNVQLFRLRCEAPMPVILMSDDVVSHAVSVVLRLSSYASGRPQHCTFLILRVLRCGDH